MASKELGALLERLKAIVAEIEAVIGETKMDKDEYLNSSEEERMKQDRKSVGLEEE